MTPNEAVAEYGSIRAAARGLGIPYSTLHGRLHGTKPKSRGSSARPPAYHRRTPSREMPTSDLLELREREFKRMAKAESAEAWNPVTITDPLPVAVLWFGDPHIDDNSCHVPLLRHHVNLCATTPGLYGANIGDTTNNWAGRLARLYAEQDTSRATARQLARWLLCEAGVDWLVWIMGNHDAWESGSDILRGMNANGIVMHDWEAKLAFRFPGGRELRVHAAHDFPGHSQWNIGHGPGKAARMSSDADLYVCGHKHDWTIQQFEIAGRNRVPTIIRARGYKWFDHYAKLHGFQSSQSGAGILTIFNPAAADPAGRVMAFSDVDAGVTVLKALRAAAAAQQSVAPAKRSAAPGPANPGARRSRRKGKRNRRARR